MREPSAVTNLGGGSGEVKHAGEGGDAVAEWGRLLQVPRRERAGVREVGARECTKRGELEERRRDEKRGRRAW